ncbi:hypothetical protein apy_02510, partial [Aeropyrum pernix]
PHLYDWVFDGVDDYVESLDYLYLYDKRAIAIWFRLRDVVPGGYIAFFGKAAHPKPLDVRLYSNTGFTVLVTNANGSATYNANAILGFINYSPYSHIDKEQVHALYRIPHIITDGLNRKTVSTLLNISLSQCTNRGALIILSEPIPWYRDEVVQVRQDAISGRVFITVKRPILPGFLIVKTKTYSNSIVKFYKDHNVQWESKLSKGEVILPFYIDELTAGSDYFYIEFEGSVIVRGATYITMDELSYFISMLEKMKKCGLLEITPMFKDFISKIENVDSPGAHLYTSLFKKLYQEYDSDLGRGLSYFLSDIRFLNATMVEDWPYSIRLETNETLVALYVSWRMFHYPKVYVRGASAFIAVPSYGGLTSLIVINPMDSHIEIRLELFDAFKNIVVKSIPLFYLAAITLPFLYLRLHGKSKDSGGGKWW